MDSRNLRLGYHAPRMRTTFISIFSALALSTGTVQANPEPPSAGEATVTAIRLQRANVFDLSRADENNWLYRLANRLHIVTREDVVRKQLLIDEGEAYSTQLAAESERILRQNRYLFDARIRPVPLESGAIELVVDTRDVWTLGPDLSVSRKGGENTSRFGIEELNFLGRGQTLRFNHEENVDRRSNSFEFFDRHLGTNWISMHLQIGDHSDGSTQRLSLIRPFYALDTRWSAGAETLLDDRRRAFYALGDETAEYQRERDYYRAFGGWSAGRNNGWVKRWTAGIVYDDRHFGIVDSPSLPAVLPEDRKLVYPWVGFEWLEDQFDTARNQDQIGKTEDFYMGARITGSMGLADEAFGADRSAIVYSLAASRGLGSLKSSALLLRGSISGRHSAGRAENRIVSGDARYYFRQSEKRLFFVTARAVYGHALDLDNLIEIGGDTGLRGYPLRYQTGESSALISLEQRFFTDWYPFRLVRIGAAVFADAGRVWGANPLGTPRKGWLTDVGLGLRFAPTRSSSGKMVHLDIAFPLNGDSSIDSVQILLESKRSF